MSALTKDEERIYIEALESQGFFISKKAPVERASAKLGIKIKPGGTVRIGIISDTHFGSKFQQPTALRDFYKYADARGVEAYLHGGDMLEGIHQAHRDATYEQYAHGVDAQVKACVKEYPRSERGPTYFVDGNHDSWAFENVGVTSGLMLADKREDFQYLGYHSAFVEIGTVRFLLQHGSRGGSAYTKSYKPQRLIEGLSDTERASTDIALFGHWHTDAYLGRYMGVFTYMLPCFKAQDRYLRSIGRNPTIGGLVLEIEFTRDGKVWNLRDDWRYYQPKLGDYPGGEHDK